MGTIKNPAFHRIALQVGGSHYPDVGGELLEKFGYEVLRQCGPQSEDLVIHLHNIARLVELQIGRGQLSNDIRGCADRLHELSKVT